MQNINHRQYVRSLYKHLLSEAGLFFDDRARTFMINRIKHRFRVCQSLSDIDRIKNKIIEGRKSLHGIERANTNDRNSVMRILQATYGRSGKVRHLLLTPYVEPNPSPSFHPPEPFYPHIPHTAPPAPLCPPLQMLITKLQAKKLEPELPQPKYKPLHLGRKANLLWAWRSKLLSKAQVPLPVEILNELEAKALPPATESLLTADGGPAWDMMYGPQQRKYQIEGNDLYIHLAHLDPQAKLVPRTKFKRSSLLTISPYSNPHSTMSPFSTASMLSLIEEDERRGHDSTKEVSKVIPLKPRQVRRHYQRLLSEIPCMTGLSSREALWDQNQRHTVFRSPASTDSVRRILTTEELPSEDVIEKSMASSGKKRKQTKAKLESTVAVKADKISM